MTESKIYADDYSCTFKEPGEFLDFLRERKEHSQWLTAPLAQVLAKPLI